MKHYLSRPNTTVIGTVRDPSAPDSKVLKSLPTAHGSKVIVVKVESKSDRSAAEAISSLPQHGVSHIDVVIANAGIFRQAAFQKVSEMKTADLMEHVNVNAAGVIRLFQAVLPLLQKASKPIFMVVSSGVATIAGMEYVPFTVSSYGASKATINYLVRRIHFENPELIAFAVHPGCVPSRIRSHDHSKKDVMLTTSARAVKTDEGNAAARFFGLPEAFTTVDESVTGLLGKVCQDMIPERTCWFRQEILTG